MATSRRSAKQQSVLKISEKLAATKGTAKDKLGGLVKKVRPGRRRSLHKKPREGKGTKAQRARMLLEEHGLCPISLAPMRCAHSAPSKYVRSMDCAVSVQSHAPAAGLHWAQQH